MKKSVVFPMLVVFLTLSYTANAQLGGLVKKVKNNTVDKVLGDPQQGQQADKKTVKKDPDCACKDAKLIFGFSDSLKIDYKEYAFSVANDGQILISDKIKGEYYIADHGKLHGPYDKSDPLVKQFELPESNGEQAKIEDLMAQYKGIIVPSGEKYAIKFNGKTYGPYAVINSFMQNHSGTKFAAMVTKDVMMSEAQGKILEEKSKNAKTQEEQMQLAMEMSQQMQQTMMANGGTMDITPKLVTNIPGAQTDMVVPGSFSAKVKFDEIVLTGYDKISDLTGKTLITLDPAKVRSFNGLWLSSDNSRLATFSDGTLSIGDDKVYTEVFCPYVAKFDGKVNLTYMYFSPENNAIMQCRLPF